MHPQLLPFGANFAVRKQAQKLFSYDTALGRRPSNMTLGGEETRLLKSLLSVGHVGYWVPTASVEHRLNHSRMTIRYLIKHGIGMGRTLVKLSNESEFSKNQPFSKSVLDGKKFIRAVKKALVFRIKNTPNEWVPAIYEASIRAGRLFESIK